MLLGMTMTVFAAAALSTLSSNSWTPWQVALQDDATDTLHRLASRQRLERIELALEIFYLDVGRFPGELSELTAGGYLDPPDLLDPWGQGYATRTPTSGSAPATGCIAPGGSSRSGRRPGRVSLRAHRSWPRKDSDAANGESCSSCTYRLDLPAANLSSQESL